MGFKKFVINRTTVTILGIVAGVAVLVGFYIYRVNNAVNPTRVPIATREILPTEEITADDIEMVSISSSFLSDANVITSTESLIGKYIATGTSIPEGGLFYSNQIVEKEDLPNAVFEEIPDGDTIYQLPVNETTTYANSIYPGDRIDLSIKSSDPTTGRVIFGEFISSIEVLAVRDSAGQNVFDVTSGREADFLLFAVPTDLYRYLKLAEWSSNMQVIPVPRNQQYTEDAGATEYDNEQLINLILQNVQDMGGNYSSGSSTTEEETTPPEE